MSISTCSPSSDQSADCAAVVAFIDNAKAIARGVDQKLAQILDDLLDGRMAAPAAATRWSGERNEGLKLVLSLLRYVRPEAEQIVDVSRVDMGISYISRELAKTEPRPLPPSRRSTARRTA